jgi:transposase-like protein
MENCKHCGSEKLRKNGFNRGKQRYFCKDCGKSQVEGDNREKYSEAVKNAALFMYLEGIGFRSIARILRKIFSIKINYQLIIYWIKNFGKSVEFRAKLVEKSRKIPVLELDELYTYIKKNSIKSEYGLLLIEIDCVLLDLRLETAVPQLSKSSGKE